jgi:tRNA-Thr(GGU) m(6)t(6)A37 methyltransferase TsaA
VEPPFQFQPIGHVRSGKDVRFEARHQPNEADPERNVLELLPEPGFREALRDLDGMDRIWLVWVFHRANSWRPLVLPPRGPAQRRGLFATRSPHRPNPIGLTPVRLVGIEGLRLVLGPCDLMDGTPVLDIKPYAPSYDSFPDAQAGWIDEVDDRMALPPAFTVVLAPRAAEQSLWLRERWNVDFLPRMTELLARDPSPHRTRRIRTRPGGRFDIGCGTWKGVFTVEGTTVKVQEFEPSYPVRFLTEAWRTGIPDHDAQLDFLSRWPCPALELRTP